MKSIVGITAMIIFCSQPCFAADGVETFTGRVVGISDGDTIAVLRNGEPAKIRVAGIDCPEVRQAYGAVAKVATANLVFGKQVTVSTHGRDRYGRFIGDVSTPDGTRLKEELLKRGLAWHFVRYDHDYRLQLLEDQAHAAHLGLWQDEDPVAPWEFRHCRRKERGHGNNK